MAVELLEIERCVGCGQCVLTCPCDVFRIDPGRKKAVIAYPDECQVCSMCTIYCPTGVVNVSPDKIAKPMTAYR